MASPSILGKAPNGFPLLLGKAPNGFPLLLGKAPNGLPLRRDIYLSFSRLLGDN